MTYWIALLRGINVGGHGKLPMQDLRDLTHDLGGADVQTYIQSGNLIFKHAETSPDGLAARLKSAIAEAKGFCPEVVIYAAEEFLAIAEAAPFAPEQPNHLMVFFAQTRIDKARLPDLEAIAAPSEEIAIRGRALVLHAPEGIARSKLAVKAEKICGVSLTARNGKTLGAISALLQS